MKLVGNRLIECASEDELNLVASILDKDITELEVPLDVGCLRYQKKKFIRHNKFEIFKFVGRSFKRGDRTCVE